MGRVLIQQRDYRKALERLQEAVAAYYRRESLPGEAEEAIGGLYLDLNEVDKAEPIILKFSSDASLGRLALAKSDYAEALKHYEHLKESAEHTGKVDELFTAYTGLGRASEALKDYPKAEEFYSLGVRSVEELRSGLLPAARRSFFAVRINGFDWY